MSSYALQPLGGWRNEACLIPITVPGLDLAGIPVRAQVRLAGDTPGAALIDLATGAAAGATGIQTLATTHDVAGIPTSHLMFQIAKADMQALPYAGEVGDAWVGAYALQIAGVTRLTGPFSALASPIDSDNAPLNRLAGYGLGGRGTPITGVSLTIGDAGVAVSIDGLDLVAASTSLAQIAATDATNAADTVAQTLAAMVSALRWVAVIPEAVPALVIDFYGQRCWVIDRIEPFGNVLTPNGDGSFRITDVVMARLAPLFAGTGYTLAVDYSFPDYYNAANAPSGCLVSMGTPGQGGNRFEVTVQQTATPAVVAPGGAYQVSTLLSALADNSVSGNLPFSPDTVRIQRMQGIHRETISVPYDAATPVRVQTDGGITVEVVANRAASTAPTKIEIYRRVIAEDELAANVSIHQIIIYAQPLEDAGVSAVGLFNEHRLPAILIEGDSATNNGQVQDCLLLQTQHLGYIPTTWEGQGSRGLNYHVGLLTAMIASNPKFASYMLLLCEYGLDHNGAPYGQPFNGASEGPWSTLDLLHFLRSIRTLFTERRWMLLESTPNSASLAGNADIVLPQYNEAEAAFRSAYPYAWTPWVALMQAQTIAANGRSADDEYAHNLASQIIPGNMLNAGDQVHLGWLDPSGAPGGYTVLGQALAEKRGIITGVG